MSEYPQSLPIGDVIAGYEIRRVLGQGGFGIAYEAWNEDLELRAAMKEFFPREMATRQGTKIVATGRQADIYPKLLDKFIEEARAVARLDHPGIIKVRHLERANGTAYMFMDFVEGTTLREWWREGKPSPERLRRVFAPVMDALEAVHREDMLHRDISPVNILVDTTGRPLLIDFGAFKHGWQRDAAASSLVTANPAYAPPEQMDRVGGARHGAYTDIYALAATMYELISGKPPVGAVTRMGALAARQPDPLAPSAEVMRVAYPPEVTAAIDKALSFDAKARPQTMAAFRAMLGWDRAGQAPIEVPRFSGVQRLVAGRTQAIVRKLRVDPRAGLAAAGIAGAVVVAGLGIWGVAAGLSGGGSAAAARCDALARPPWDAPDGRGVARLEEIDAAAAVAACREAVHARPSDPRMQYQLGRALLAGSFDVEAREWITKASTAGSTSATHALGFIHFNGRGVAKDPAKARQHFEAAAARGMAPAMAALGSMHEDGEGVPRDYAKAREWFEKAAAKGNDEGMTALGRLFYNGHGVAQDYARARSWFEQAAAKDNHAAMRALGEMHASGDGIPRNEAKAFEWFEKSASRGNSGSMNAIGLYYEQGRGVTQDLTRARTWYERASAKGNAVAMTNLGVLYEAGRGVQQDYRRAREWFERAAGLNNPRALYRLGILYFNGNGVAQDYGRAREWLEKAVVLNHTDAMNDLGWMHEHGRGGPVDIAKALNWYEQAAARGSTLAMTNLGLSYRHARGVARDFVKAREWYEKAAAGGNRRAMFEIGDLHEKGQGVARDCKAALAWYRRSADAGYDEAKKRIPQVERRCR